MVDRCRYCQNPIRILPCRDGRSRSFEAGPRDLAADPARTGFVLVRYRRLALTRVLATPVVDVAERKLSGDVKVFMLHFCAEYTAHQMRIKAEDMGWLAGPARDRPRR